jgi:hypothetical protein
MKTLKNLFLLLLFVFPVFAKSQNIEWQYFSLKGIECRIFTTKGNSRIIVPANCFSLNGTPYSGEVKIAFKEYKDQADFILGGLNLRYETNGVFTNLQSGGMFEINITTGGKASKSLTYTNNKKVTVKFAIDPNFDVAGLEPFYFDNKTGKWIKTTRFGKTKEGNSSISDKPSDLWQDDPRLLDFNNQQNDDSPGNGDCYTISVPDPQNPEWYIDTVICPDPANILDSKYDNYLSSQAFKTMQIDKMGLYNFDKIFNEENTVPMFVKLKTKDGKPLNLTEKLYVVYKNSNSVIYYNKTDLDSSFSLIPRNDIKIFTINADGSISKVPDSFWVGVNLRLMRGKTLELKFENIKLSTVTKEEFAAATGLKN